MSLFELLTNIVLGVIASILCGLASILWRYTKRKTKERLIQQYRSQLRQLRHLQYFMELEKAYVEELRDAPDSVGKAAMRRRVTLTTGVTHQRLYPSDIRLKISRVVNKLNELEG